MSFDLKALQDAVDKNGPVARIVITGTKGSAPRNAGTSMLVWADGQSDTIGGGSLEFQAVTAARALLERPGAWLRQKRAVPLGPALGQCCGGSVNLLTEVFEAAEVAKIATQVEPLNRFNRSMLSGAKPLPDGAGSDCFSEEITNSGHPLWIYGAGHVGRALVAVLPPLGFDVTWVDTAADRFPETLPANVTQLIAANPGDVVRYAPSNARHLILTYSHALDFELCHQVLSHGFQFAGLIGSATKWARFQKRLASLGHSQDQISRITCPIGLPELGKAPAAIALGVATTLLRSANALTDAQLSGYAKEHTS